MWDSNGFYGSSTTSASQRHGINGLALCSVASGSLRAVGAGETSIEQRIKSTHTGNTAAFAINFAIWVWINTY